MHALRSSFLIILVFVSITVFIGIVKEAREVSRTLENVARTDRVLL